ncbi:S-adenosyl-L-methionine-dependent methyltransferase [Aspergillus cavernicola]|uniref:S-adenosyl-L-methionine-dependent methyltransferase n=1 Tax=Aspergillus cavernicola TaxID=176166 RepID=A0ABR4IP68_9EURO
MAATESAVAEATATIAQLATIDVSDPTSHSDIIRKCNSVASALQHPGALALQAIASAADFPALVVLNDLGVFQKLAEGPLTAIQLAEKCGADRWLIVRLLRVATAAGMIQETGPESYAATPTSNILAIPSFAAGISLSHLSAKIIYSLRTYFKETQYRNPRNYLNGPFQSYLDTPLGSFEWLAQNEETRRDFNLFMTIQRTRGQHWTTNFNIKSRILHDSVPINPDAPLYVDVGGGLGQDLRLVKAELGDVSKGQLVLEDQVSTINNIPTDLHDADFEYIPHDFFTAQPVKGARVYSFKGVLHDWPDDKALQILSHIVAVMTPGYSRVWILDGIVPDTGADKVLAELNLCMMAWYGALERNREQWGELLGQAGLRVVGVQTMDDGFGLIEAVLER